MNRVLEYKFFREFQHHGAAIMSLDMMHFEYCGIGNGTAGRPDYPDGVLAEIRQRTESFDTWPWGGVENCSPLMDEIADNIALCQAGSREAYVEEMLRKMQTWTFLYSLAKDKLDAVSNTIQIHTIEDFFWTWRNAFRTFAEKLAVILAKLGINLLEIQNRCGISIIEHLDADELWQDFGTRELANYYLSKLNIASGQVDSKIGKRSEHKKKGRRVKDFRDCLLVNEGEKDAIIEKLRSLIAGRKGKDVALIIYVCIKLGLLTKPSFSQVNKAFGGDTGNKSGYNNYVNTPSKFSEEEISGMIERLKRL